MTAHKSIALAIDLAQAQRDQALQRLQLARQANTFAQQQMQQLTDYLRETEQRWVGGARVSVAPELLHHHYQFVARLTHAIDLQEGVLRGTRIRVETAERDLLSVEMRLASFNQLLTKRRADEARHRQRQDQKQMDEFAMVQVQRQRQRQAENPT